MNLFTNEQIITSSNDNQVVLTNYRIHSETKDWGRSYSNTIFLEDISSVEVKYSSVIIFLILGAFALLAWISQMSNAMGDTGVGLITIFLAIAFLLLYWFSRRHVIAITPNGGKAITFLVANM
jgi:hypothetical protein